MNFILQPWQLLFVLFAGWVRRQQQEVIDCDSVLHQGLGNRLLEPGEELGVTRGYWTPYPPVHYGPYYR